MRLLIALINWIIITSYTACLIGLMASTVVFIYGQSPGLLILIIILMASLIGSFAMSFDRSRISKRDFDLTFGSTLIVLTLGLIGYVAQRLTSEFPAREYSMGVCIALIVVSIFCAMINTKAGED